MRSGGHWHRQKSAWFVLQRLRLVLKETRPVVMGGVGNTVVTDETFVGGKVTNMHHRRLQEQKKQVRSLRVQQYNNVWGNKIAVQGFFDKTTREIRATVVPNVKRRNVSRRKSSPTSYGVLRFTPTRRVSTST